VSEFRPTNWVSEFWVTEFWADKRRAGALLTASGLDFVNVLPGRLIDAPAQPGMRASLDGRGLQPRMTREDLAAFMVDQLEDNRSLGPSVVVGY
jgi:NAD(P)H-binding